MQKTTNGSFFYNLGGLLAFGYIFICIAISVLAYVIAPDNSVNANQMHLSIHSQPPGFEVKMLHVPTNAYKDNSPLSMLLFGNPNAGNQYPISSTKLGTMELGLNISTLILLVSRSGFRSLLSTDSHRLLK